MPTYPDYLYQTLARARDIGQWYCRQANAAALCFDMLALFPNCIEASDLVYELFCDEWMIYDNRVAIQQNIDEWDDRPWQQRRRLALSFRFMSRWEGWEREYMDGYEKEQDGPPDVTELLENGRMELLGAYCLGDEECTNYAWAIFSDALNRSSDPHGALLWIGKQYADLGFFADAAEALDELCSRFTDQDAKRLLTEVIWWRDNAHRIPWIPPSGDGSRYYHMMDFIAPNAPKTNEYIREARNESQRERIAPYRPTINPQLAELLSSSLPAQAENPSPVLVDWSFLDLDDGQPDEPADWVRKQAEMFADEPEIVEDTFSRHRWTRPIQPPSTPSRYDPNEPPFDPGDALDQWDL